MDRLATIPNRERRPPHIRRQRSPVSGGLGVRPILDPLSDPEALDRSRVRTLRIPPRPSGANVAVEPASEREPVSPSSPLTPAIA